MEAEAVPAGLKPVRKRLSDGSERIYYFDRKTGVALGVDRAIAIERLRQMRDDDLAPRSVDQNSFNALVAAYRHSPEFQDRAPTTRSLYQSLMGQLLEEFFGARLSAITPPVIFALRDRVGLKEGHRHKANNQIRMLRILFGFAQQRRLLGTKPTDNVPLLAVDARSQVWTTRQIDMFLDEARASLRTGMALLLYTVQRLSDVLSLTRANLQVNDLDGRLWIGLRQSKTDTLVWTPCHSKLADVLQALPADQDLLVPAPRGGPWARRNFSRAWDLHISRVNRRLAKEALSKAPLGRTTGKARAKAKAAIRTQLLGEVQRRDLRRTGMVQMALAGATPNQIAAVSGHSIDEAMKILDVYIPRRGDVAASAIRAWEATAPTGLQFSPPRQLPGNQFPAPGNRQRLKLVNA